MGPITSGRGVWFTILCANIVKSANFRFTDYTKAASTLAVSHVIVEPNRMTYEKTIKFCAVYRMYNYYNWLVPLCPNFKYMASILQGGVFGFIFPKNIDFVQTINVYIIKRREIYISCILVSNKI